MYRYVTDFLSRRSKRRSRVCLPSNQYESVRLPPTLYIPPSKERASLFRKQQELASLARTTNNIVPMPGVDLCELALPGRDSEPRDGVTDSD